MENTQERLKMVKAMEFIARQINDVDILKSWFSVGVADGDIEYGDLSTTKTTDDVVFYTEDANFCDLMDTFLYLMTEARKSGGLYCDGVRSRLNW